MAMDEYFQEPMLYQGMEDNDEKPWQNSVSSSSAKTLNNIDDGFQCNICLDHPNEPVVTLCGHLYCWPCIYKWLHFQNSSDQQPQCPVCKSDVSQSMIVPLYGRGNSQPQSESNNEKSPVLDVKIPSRPSAHSVHAILSATSTNTGSTTPNGGQVHGRSFQSQSTHPQQYYPEFYNQPTMFSNSLGSPTMMRPAAVHPMVGMFGEMVYARIFGNDSEMGSVFVHPNSYYLMENNSTNNARIRRQEMKAEKSLNRISIFLFCCLVLCLLSF